MPVPTFIDAAELLIQDAEVRVKLGEAAPTLPLDYRYRLNAHCRPFFGDSPVAGVTRPRLREFRVYLVEKGLKPATLNTILSFTSMTLKFAEDAGLIAEAPVVPRARLRDRPRSGFTKEEYERLLQGLSAIEKGRPKIVVKGQPIDWELRAIVTFAVNSFVRPGDLVKLRHRHIEVRRTAEGRTYLRMNYAPSKGHPEPVITMPAAAQVYERVLARRRRAPRPDDFLFLPERENRYYAHQIVRLQFIAALERLRLRRTPGGAERTLYSLRHTAITFRLLDGGDLDLVTLARNCRTSVEMIDRFYASALTAEMNARHIIGAEARRRPVT
jgi:integrase